MTRQRGRTQTCGPEEARTRAGSAAKFLEVAPDRERGRGGVQKCSGLKDAAQYGIVYVSRDDLKVAMRQAVRMVDFANEVIRR